MPPLSRRRAFAVFSAYLLLHLGFDGAARLFEVSPGLSLWYPPAGLALSLVVMFGWRAVPVVLAAQLTSGLIGGFHGVWWLPVALPLLITGVYGLAGGLIRRGFGPVPRPTKPLEPVFLLAIFLLAPATAAALGTLVVWSTGWLLPEAVAGSLVRWWIGDFTGVITIVPLCFVHVAPRLFGKRVGAARTWTWPRVVEVAGEAVLLLGCVWLVNGVEALRGYRTHFLCFVPLVLICLRHGLPGATLATCVLTMSSLAAMSYFPGSTANVIDLVLFVASVSAVGLGVGWSVTRRTYLEDERARIMEILEATTDVIGTCDLEGRITYLNSAYVKLRGLPPGALRGTRARDAYPAWAADKVFKEGVPRALRTGSWHGETALLDRDGEEIPVSQVIIVHFDAEHRPVAFSTIARDIRDQKRAERARLESERNLLQAQKLESLGVLAGGIAHDFNNLLTVMLGHATLAGLELPADSPGAHAVHQIELAAQRAAELCRQMLAYSGKGRLATELVDLSRIVAETTHLLEVSISEGCELEFALQHELPPVDGDPTQLSQIAMNLVMNASEACGENGGRIVVRTGVVDVDHAYLATTYLSLPAAPGRYVFLEVSDGGAGMTPEILRRIFEPFYTTKFSGHGLGLSAVLGIVRSHRGAVKVESEHGRGTTFRVLLPAAAGTASAGAPKDRFDLESWRGSGQVLVADDEEAVREVASQILRRFGFEPIVARDGRDAVEIFRRHPAGFRAVLIDLSMPVMNGRDASHRIQQMNPEVPVLLMSGYNHINAAERHANDRFSGFIQKPFETTRLISALRDALDGTCSGIHS